MVPERPSRSVSDVPEILASICSKWGLLVLYELSGGPRRHSELQRAIRGVSQKMLTQTLRQLERDGLVHRTAYAVIPPRVDYALTPLGQTLTAPLAALYQWMEQHLEQIQDARLASPPGPAAAGPGGPERP
jgi:DNA-binding HxlR family transcriptional regulator